MQNETYTDTASPVNGRVLLELKNGRITLYPVTSSDEETVELLDAILQHVAQAIQGRK